MIKEKLKRTAYHTEYNRKARAEIKANPNILTIISHGYIMTSIEVQKGRRCGEIDGAETMFAQPKYSNIPNMALISCKRIKSRQNDPV